VKHSSLPTTTEGSPRRHPELNRRSGSTGTLEKAHQVVVKKNNYTEGRNNNENKLFVLPQKNKV